MSLVNRLGAAGLVLLCAQTLAAQEGSADLDAKLQDISKRLRATLERQSRILSQPHPMPLNN